MNISHCPVCKDPLLNTIFSDDNLIYKACKQRLYHSLFFIYDSKKEVIKTIGINFGKNNACCAYFNLLDKILFISDASDFKEDLYIPFFEPDFSDYKKIISKLKTYILFS